ncbi:MAG: TonB-dependent receptor [Bacteroidales bacterium]|nr:TonB-dependent receptor [Bacteroidales bacterium]
MKRIILLLSVMILVYTSGGQQKTRDKVKRKYRQTETIREGMPEVLVSGRVFNAQKEPLAGASVVIRGSMRGVNTNEEGEYYLRGVTTGVVSFQASFVGYKTKIIDYYLQEGINDVNFTLDRENVALEPVTVTSQQREQNLPDISGSITALGSTFLASNDIRDLAQMAFFVPGLQIREQTPHRPNYVIRGLTSDEVSLTAQPRVSVYFNNVPVSRPSMASAELYDMESVEVLRGPQGTLFGRGSQAGAIHYITRKAGPRPDGFLSAGYGEFNMKDFRGAVGGTILKEKLFARGAGFYTMRDGYVTNTFGESLNGKNSLGGRFSLRYLPFWNTTVDLVVNYQQDDLPGTAFMSRQFPNTNGVSDIFKYEASLDQGEKLNNYRDILGTSLEIRRFRNENNYLTSVTSYTTNHADSRWDGDGTAAPAINMAEAIDVRQFTQELRYNFSLNSRINGFAGAGFWREKARQNYFFNPNEQYMAYLILQMPQYLVSPAGESFPMTALPPDPRLGPLAGMPLPTQHEEENITEATNQSIDLFADATWKLTWRLSLTAGIRATRETFRLSNLSRMNSGSPSTLGMLTGMYPNLFFMPVDETEEKESWTGLTYRAKLKYDLGPNSNLFAGYTKGRRPPVIQFNSSGTSEIMREETLHSFDAGLKSALGSRFWFDATAFYQLFNNFQTNAWVENNYLVRDAGKATSYGVETSAKLALLRNLTLFGNYGYIHARFDSLDSQGNAQEYAGNQFRLTPEHSFTAGVDARFPLLRGIWLFAVPSWSWQSHVWFEDANTPQLDQSAYGTLNANAGIILTQPGVTLSVSGTNLLEEKYVISAGNTGTLFGVPTYIPGPPRMISGKITWRF